MNLWIRKCLEWIWDNVDLYLKQPPLQTCRHRTFVEPTNICTLYSYINQNHEKYTKPKYSFKKSEKSVQFLNCDHEPYFDDTGLDVLKPRIYVIKALRHLQIIKHHQAHEPKPAWNTTTTLFPYQTEHDNSEFNKKTKQVQMSSQDSNLFCFRGRWMWWDLGFFETRVALLLLRDKVGLRLWWWISMWNPSYCVFWWRTTLLLRLW